MAQNHRFFRMLEFAMGSTDFLLFTQNLILHRFKKNVIG
jgi:hypothetical protein